MTAADPALSTPQPPRGPTLAFVDVETTGLEPNRHETWEVAAVVRGHERPEWDGLWRWVLRVHRLTMASPDALTVSRYYARGLPLLEAAVEEQQKLPQDFGRPLDADPNADVDALLLAAPPSPTGPAFGPRLGPTSRDLAARWIATVLEGAVLVGNNVAFDARFLHKLLNDAGHAAAWQYRTVDVVAMAAGCQGAPLPWRSAEVSRACGVEPPPEGLAHTAVADALWAERLFDVVSAGHHEQPTAAS